ncbi:aspartate 1-decarboxylase [Achromobacter piechaudii ATCC 43553]|uniref:Aspartate 1-decarboxylase n=4 Tax=Achromobacter TaxID=222 RepID=D4XAJ7_9BURK|nr:aspartate 1-decarboxylase [Achromobacter piechaudii ATCC 43553]
MPGITFATRRGPDREPGISIMQRIMLRAKLHRVTVTEADLHYEGSCGIDEDLLDAAGMREFERIELYNVTNGERFDTYIIKAARGSGAISLNGAAARRAQVGDLLIICTYGPMSEEDSAKHKPQVVLVDDANRVKEIRKFPA